MVLIDDHSRPGGQWNDSYDFVRLHQPSEMYGVESTRLEGIMTTTVAEDYDRPYSHPRSRQHRATREEILTYYDSVCGVLESKFDFRFVGGTRIDLDMLGNENDVDMDYDGDENVDENDDGVPARTTMPTTTTSTTTSTTVDDGAMKGTDRKYRRYELSNGNSILARKLVDARYLQPDLPCQVPPRFSFNPNVIRCHPVNALSDMGYDDDGKGGVDKATTNGHYVVIGAGKTGMDAITYLIQCRYADPNDIIWIVPNDAWITARENIGSCMEFLHDCTTLLEREGHYSEDETGAVGENLISNEFFHRGFLEWERRGKVYRFDKDVLPTKFKDATLCKEELDLLRKVTRVVRRGRVESIDDGGTMHFDDGTSMEIPWSTTDTTYVHCSAGAFNYSKRTKKPPPVFSRSRISIQDVYGTPGFCFVGSIIGKLEALGAKLTDAEKNAMCSAPSPDPTQAKLSLGPSSGDVGVLTKNHGYVQRLTNLRKWLRVPEIRGWLVGHRLFNLGHLAAEELDAMVEETWCVLEKYNVVSNFE